MSRDVLLAVDGGGSKTDAVLFDRDGTVLRLTRMGTTSPDLLGYDAARDALLGFFREMLAQAGLDLDTAPTHAAMAMHGLDLPHQEADFAELCADFAGNVWVGNDIFAVLRAGTEHGWGVAVGAGSGMNAVGVHPDGTVARFIALGGISGDWGGGYDLGQAAVGAACRAADGRGPDTALLHAVPRHYGLPGPLDVAAAFSSGEIEAHRIVEAARLILELADDDGVAGALIDRQVEEITALAAAAARRAGLIAPPVILSGGLIQSGCPRLLNGTSVAIANALGSRTTVAASPPIAGAALIAADRAAMGAAARERLTAEICLLAGTVVSDGAVIR